jgi:DNA-binding transcriptional LysR family regulator
VDLVRHLRYFLVVAEELHFGRAAQRLFMAQPALSQRIRRLEREYGAELFDRSGGRVRLTPAGELLRAEAGEIVARVERSRLLVQRAASDGPGPLRAGVPPQVPGRVLAALAAGFAAVAPETELDLRELTTAEQVRLLAGGELDAGLLHDPVETAGLELGPPVPLPQGVALPRMSPLAEAAELTLGDLTGLDLVLFPRTAAPGLYDETMRTCRRHGFDPARVLHAHSPEFALGLVAAGHGVAFDEGTAARREPRVHWRPLLGNPVVWRIRPAWPASAAHRQAARFGEVAGLVLAQEAAEPLPRGSAGSVPRPWSVVFPAGRGRSA